jgi:peptide/nickel transport system ATP-binding protein
VTALEGAPGTVTQPPVPPEPQPVLEISELSVDYGLGADALHAVADASLSVYRGGVLGLAGESGSGKSTLVYAATRLLRSPGVVTAGSVVLHSYGETGTEKVPTTVDLLAASEAELRRVRWSEVSVVPQSALNGLNPVVRVGTQFTDVFKAHCPGLGRAERRRRAAELMDMVGISARRLDDYPHRLSGGQRQRIMIALALALRPQVVIMDEPTTALDVVTQRQVLEELATLRRELGFAMLFITHDLSLLIEVADEIAIMYAGRIVERAGAQDVFRHPRHPYTRGLLASFPPMHGEVPRMSGIPGAPPDLRQVPSGCPFHPRCQLAFDRCRSERPPLAAFGNAAHPVACWAEGDQP